MKPENVFVSTHGQVKLLDFGLAKRNPLTKGSSDPGATTQDLKTEPGTILGSIAYMSPEQVRGEPADFQSDLFSFGVILCEMLRGAHPFLRASTGETMSAILRDEPPPPEGSVPGIAGELDQIVCHCLNKSRAARARSAHDLAFRLTALLEGSPSRPVAQAGPAIESLAVLPFFNQSQDSETEYLSDGITETIIDNLSQIPSLKVMARSTVFSYKGTEADPRKVGQELGVRTVVNGRLRQRGDTLMIRAELVDATDGSSLWGGRYDRPFGDLLTIEEEIAREISENLRLKLSGEEKRRLAKRHTDNPEAHHAYLKGRFSWNRWTPENLWASIDFFKHAIALDPNYALAYAGLADSYSVIGNIKALPPDEAYGQAKIAALKGLALDNRIAELHASLGFIHRFYDWDWAAAESEFQRAVALNPGYATGRRWYAQFLSGMARHEEAIAEADASVERDPLSLIILAAAGDVYFYARRYDEAVDLYKKTIEMDPQFLAAHTDLARAYELKGMFEEAVAEFELAANMAPGGPPEPSSGLAHVYARMGRRDEALEIVEQLLEASKRKYISPYGIASIYACLGENELAMEWLEKAFESHDQTLVFLNVHPRLDSLRPDARFQDLLARMGFE